MSYNNKFEAKINFVDPLNIVIAEYILNYALKYILI